MYQFGAESTVFLMNIFLDYFDVHAVWFSVSVHTVEPLYNAPCYNMDSDRTPL